MTPPDQRTMEFFAILAAVYSAPHIRVEFATFLSGINLILLIASLWQ